MPGPTVNIFSSDPVLPKSADVVVVGGGIIGVATALELAERGVSVLLCEKGAIAGEQSSRNWGWVRIALRDTREIPLMAAAHRAWDKMDARVGAATGFTRSGILFTTASDKAIAGYERWAEHLRPHQIDARVVSGHDLDALMPGTEKPAKAALYTPLDGRAEPQWAAPAMAEAARRAGASIVTACAVRSLETEAGRISGVVTEKGRVRCNAVVLAGGVWSRLFAGNADVDIPQLGVLNTVLRTTPVAGPDTSIWTGDYAIRKRADGGYTVASGYENTHDIVPDSFRLAASFWPAYRADWRHLRFRVSGRWREEATRARSWHPDEVTPFEHCRVLDPAPSARHLRSSLKAARRAFPVFEKADVVQSWGGLIDVTPDAIPIISEVQDHSGLHIATGFSGHGFGISPGAGRLMADLVTGSTPVVDPHDFRLSRFTDGSRITAMGEY